VGGKGGGIGGGQELAGVREETPPGVAEFHAAGAPDEQLLAERPLQPRNPLGQGLLGEEQLGRGPAEMQLLGGGDEGSHLGQVQVHARHLRRQPRVVKTAMNSCWTGAVRLRSAGSRKRRPSERAGALAPSR